MRVETQTTHEHRANIRRMAAESFAHHELHHLGDAGDTKVYRFRRPDDGFYAVRILLWPGWIVVAGDTGDTMFRHSERDSLAWLRGAASNVRYMLGKVQGARKVFMAGDALAFIEREAEEDPERGRKLREGWSPIDDGSIDFYRACRDADVDDPPDCQEWESDHLWAVEALRHFIRALDAEPAP